MQEPVQKQGLELNVVEVIEAVLLLYQLLQLSLPLFLEYMSASNITD